MEEIMERMESRTALGISGIMLLAGLYGVWSHNSLWEQAAWGSIVISGLPIAWSAMGTLVRHRRITSGLLITLAIVASISIGETFAAGEIAWIMAMGELLEHGTVARAKRGLQRLLTLCPTMGRRLIEGQEEMVPADQLQPGDTLRIKPGEKIPVDGVIRSGVTSVDQSVLTGESCPVECGPGHAVYAGSMNGDGSVDVEVTHSSTDSSLARMIRLVEQAGQHHAPIQREADRWAEWLVPVSLGIALVGYIVLRALGYESGDALVRAVTVLVVFCPCALALATPTGMMAAIGQAAKHGVIIKSGEALEALAKVDTLAFDKTGTLTRGHLSVAEVSAYGVSEAELLSLVGAIESRSEHPVAKAFADLHPAQPREVSQFRALPGRGVEGVVDGIRLLCGSESAMREAGIRLQPEQLEQLAAMRSRGLVTMLVAQLSNMSLIGMLGLADAARPEAADVLAQLGSLHTVLLTGDHAGAAAYLARQIRLDDIQAELLPEDKAQALSTLRRQGHHTAMVGDGVNDAPALKQADVGIAMSRPGTDLATEAADISLMNDNLGQLPYLVRLARATLRCIRFNIAAALAINLVAVGLGLAGLLGPAVGALVHNAGSIIVILNAALLYDRRI